MVKRSFLVGILIVSFFNMCVDAAAVKAQAKPTLLIAYVGKMEDLTDKKLPFSNYARLVKNLIGRTFQVRTTIVDTLSPRDLKDVNYVLVVSSARSENDLQQQAAKISEAFPRTGLGEFANKAFVYITVAAAPQPYKINNPQFVRSFKDGIFEMELKPKPFDNTLFRKMSKFIINLGKRFRDGSLPAPAKKGVGQ